MPPQRVLLIFRKRTFYVLHTQQSGHGLSAKLCGIVCWLIANKHFGGTCPLQDGINTFYMICLYVCECTGMYFRHKYRHLTDHLRCLADRASQQKAIRLAFVRPALTHWVRSLVLNIASSTFVRLFHKALMLYAHFLCNSKLFCFASSTFLWLLSAFSATTFFASASFLFYFFCGVV